MAPPAGQAPRIPAIVTNGDTNSRVRKVVCILQNAEYRSAVVSGAYSSLISFPAVKISRFNRERKMHARALDSIPRFPTRPATPSKIARPSRSPVPSGAKLSISTATRTRRSPPSSSSSSPFFRP